MGTHPGLSHKSRGLEECPWAEQARSRGQYITPTSELKLQVRCHRQNPGKEGRAAPGLVSEVTQSPAVTGGLAKSTTGMILRMSRRHGYKPIVP